MQIALDEAARAADADEVPVGAVVVDRVGQILARAHNLTRHLADPTAHAEILALRQAAKHIGNARLSDCDLYVTLEPCAMCAGAIMHARIRRLYYGAPDEKAGAVSHNARLFNQPTSLHRPDVYEGMAGQASATLLRDFFAKKR
ncbi:MAG: nucleoside deaminase [Alphaproteobacteria bacterium]|nr:nucleoside deaminase [Alphaproteobacteria bacterium]MBE8220520.1 nucleoside deaminase [Alphaproteobacteria bacterium]